MDHQSIKLGWRQFFSGDSVYCPHTCSMQCKNAKTHPSSALYVDVRLGGIIMCISCMCISYSGHMRFDPLGILRHASKGKNCTWQKRASQVERGKNNISVSAAWRNGPGSYRNDQEVPVMTGHRAVDRCSAQGSSDVARPPVTLRPRPQRPPSLLFAGFWIREHYATAGLLLPKVWSAWQISVGTGFPLCSALRGANFAPELGRHSRGERVNHDSIFKGPLRRRNPPIFGR